METVMQRITVPSKIKLQEIARLVTEKQNVRFTSVDILEVLIEEEYKRLVVAGIIPAREGEGVKWATDDNFWCDPQNNSLTGLRVGPWVELDHCATRTIAGTDPNIVENRIAFIEKSPRVLCNGVWVYGPRGTGGGNPRVDKSYGFDPASREWCDKYLVERGAILPGDGEGEGE